MEHVHTNKHLNPNESTRFKHVLWVLLVGLITFKKETKCNKKQNLNMHFAGLNNSRRHFLESK